jgi:hypothetical protein
MEWNGIDTALKAQVSEMKRSKGWIGGIKKRKNERPSVGHV